MSNFKPFASAVAAHFQLMCKLPLVRLDIDRDLVWGSYLDAFPEGTNEIFRTRREYDGSYDRAFVKKLGNVAAIKPDGNITSIWHTPNIGYPFDIVADKMRQLIENAPILGAFRIKEPKTGYVETTERLEDGGIRTWNHFHADIPKPYYSTNVDEEVGNINTTIQVTQRGLAELTPEAVAQVLELINANAIYRGTEFRNAVAAFQKLQNRYLSSNNPQRLLWSDQEGMVGRIRNTAIGTLLQDLSEGKPLELSVKSFEAKVAPTNYKRTTALVTPGMVKEAMKTIDELGLEPALSRRYATINDLNINDVLWANGTARDVMKAGGIGEILAAAAVPKAPKMSEPTPIDIEQFVQEVLPKTATLELLVKNDLQRNLVAITTATDPLAPLLFKWANPFGWSYNGDITDSIKDKVKGAGGNIEADLRVSLAWYNSDDLDLHAHCPKGHIYFSNKNGVLDVDTNGGGPHNSVDPVENLSWIRPSDGSYQIKVHQYNQRSTNNPGFVLEVECNGVIQQLTYDKRVSGYIDAITFKMKGGVLSDLKIMHKDLRNQSASQIVWGLDTETFVEVDTLLLSPNYWGESRVGNKHWFFVLDGCANPEGTRGIYNEFLRPDLEVHRKVFELIGAKTKCPADDDNQMAGLGFSSTKQDSVTARVTGPKLNKTYNITFN